MSAIRTRDQALWIIESASRRAPATVPLARFLSLAVFVEPDLLRAMRLAFWARSGPELEGSLWFGPLVESHSASGFSLHREVVAELREQLRTSWQQGDERRQLEEAWRLVEGRHVHLSPALALEERVAWHFVVDDELAAEDELASALKAHAAGGRPGIVAWASQAWGRLPDQVRRSRTGWLFQQMARSNGTVLMPSGPRAIASVSPDDVSAVLGFLRDVPLAIQERDRVLEIGAVGGEAPIGVEVPDTEPRVLDLKWSEEGRSVRVTVAPGELVQILRGAGTLTLTNLRGQVYELSHAYPPRFKSAPSATVLVAGRALHLSPEEVEYARALGDALARAGHCMVDGGFAGVDFLAADGFEKALREVQPEVSIDRRVTHVVLAGIQPDFEGGGRQEVHSREASYTTALLRADAVVLVGGTTGTEVMYLLARDADIPVFALGRSGGVAADAAGEIARRAGPGVANCDGRPEAEMDQQQRVRASVRRYLQEAAPTEATKAIATVVTVDPAAASRTAARADAMRWIWGATTYLSAGSLGDANAIMRAFWDAMKHRDAAVLWQERWRLRSRYAADRVLGYVSVQVAPRAEDSNSLVEAAALERDHASKQRETRPLFQLLVSFQRLLDHQLVAPAQAPTVVACLTEIVKFLRLREDLDRGHQCQTHADYLLSRLDKELVSADPRAPTTFADLSDQELYERIEALRREVASELGIPDVRDTYFFFLRVGNDFDRYGFSWEPFRDLAGPLNPSPNSVPVIVVSGDGGREVRVDHVAQPLPHVRLHISPRVDRSQIASIWLDTIVDAGARHGSYQGPLRWFPDSMRLDIAALSPKARAFLRLDEPDPATRAR